MAKAIIAACGGGGGSSEDVTASRSHVLEGYTAITRDSGDEAAEGTMPSNPGIDAALNCGEEAVIPEGYSPGGRVRANSLASQTGGASADDAAVYEGKSYWKDGVKRTGTMKDLGANTPIEHMPGNPTKVIQGDEAYVATNTDGVQRAEIRYVGDGGYLPPNTLIGVDKNKMVNAGGLTAAKLMKGQAAFGINGTATSDANATAGQILSGKTAYVNGAKVTGSMEVDASKILLGQSIGGVAGTADWVISVANADQFQETVNVKTEVLYARTIFNKTYPLITTNCSVLMCFLVSTRNDGCDFCVCVPYSKIHPDNEEYARGVQLTLENQLVSFYLRKRATSANVRLTMECQTSIYIDYVDVYLLMVTSAEIG